MQTPMRVVIGAIVIALVGASLQAGNTYYVQAGAPAGGDGSAGNPFNTIQAGIVAASDTDVIIVATGSYPELIDFLGKDITVKSTNPDSATVVAATIIDGMGSGPIVSFVGGESASAILEGFTITNGAWTDIMTDGTGGVFIVNSSPTVRKNVITANQSITDGGGVAILGNASPLIQNNEISDNSVDGWGGGVFVYGNDGLATPQIAGNRISGNECYWDGGGICSFESASVTITNNVIFENTSGEVGGGMIVFFDVEATITSNTIANNQALGEDAPDAVRVGRGGGIACVHSGPTSTVDSCILWGNVAENSEGDQISLERSAYLTVNYSDVQGGQAAVFIDTSTPAPVLTYGGTNLNADPSFAPAAGDYHLQSLAGRYNPATGSWVQDAVSSICIDAGNPALAYANEPAPNGGVINIGAYGNTAQASLSGAPLGISAAFTYGWMYQNITLTPPDRHYDVVTATVNSDPLGNTTYTMAVVKTGGTGTVVIENGATSLEKIVLSSVRTDGIVGTGTVSFDVTVTGVENGGAGTTTASTKVRRLGDINDDNAVTTADSVELVKRLNGLVTGTRLFDLDANGFVTTADSVVLSKILNGLPVN